MATRMYVCESVEHPSTLLSGLNQQRLKGALCDVTVRVQGNLFKAHTNVLASSMGYFRDLFLNKPKRNKDAIIEIPMIVNSLGFAKVLDFIYTSQLCLSQSSVMQVLCSACFLQIPYVVEKCQEFIVTHGSVPAPGNLAITDLSTNGQDYKQDNQLINTPPSPNQATNGIKMEDKIDELYLNGSTHNSSSPQESLPYDTGNKATNDDNSDSKNEIFSPNNSGEETGNTASKALLTLSQHVSRFSEGQSRMKNLLQTSDNLTNDTDQIDHDSLAEYFARNNSTKPCLFGDPQYKNLAQDNEGNYKPGTNVFSIKSQFNAKDSPLDDMSSSAAHYLLAMKKEKPKKEYKCEYCSKMFGRQQHLKRHILTHTGERPYPCTLCDKRFRRSEHLKHHLVKHQTGNVEDLTTTNGRKRQRKSTPVSASARNAYDMSRLMLTYNNPAATHLDTPISTTADNQSQQSIILPLSTSTKSFISSGQTINTISVKLAQSNGVAMTTTTVENMDTNNDSSPSNMTQQESPTAINLSSKDGVDVAPPTNEEPTMVEPIKPEPVNEEPITSELSSIGKDVMLNGKIEAEEQTYEPKVIESTIGDNSNIAQQSMITSFASSEVMTNDLKNLFAAME